MAKLYFYYSTMNAGKSTILLQSAYNYQERGMETLLFTPSIDTRYGEGKITSRIGLTAKAIAFDTSFDIFKYCKEYQKQHPKLACILVDEAQFLKKQQVSQLSNIVDELNLPVLVYGLRSDYLGEPFEGSIYLLIWADNVIEIKTICFCGKKAIMHIRADENGVVVTAGNQIHIGGNESYTAVCRKHFKEALQTGQQKSKYQ